MITLSTKPNSVYYYQNNGVVYEISKTNTKHEDCADLLSLYKVKDNPIYSCDGDGNIDLSQALKHIEAKKIIDDNDVEHNYFLDTLISEGDEYLSASTTFKPNSEVGHYYDGVSATTYSELYEGMIADTIGDYVETGKSMKQIKKLLPSYVTAQSGNTISIDGKSVTVKSNELLISDEKIQSAIEARIIKMCKAYGNSLLSREGITDKEITNVTIG